MKTGVRGAGWATTSISNVWPSSPPLRSAVKRPPAQPKSGQRDVSDSVAIAASADGSGTAGYVDQCRCSSGAPGAESRPSAASRSRSSGTYAARAAGSENATPQPRRSGSLHASPNQSPSSRAPPSSSCSCVSVSRGERRKRCTPNARWKAIAS